MKLDRNLTESRIGKYALIRLDKLRSLFFDVDIVDNLTSPIAQISSKNIELGLVGEQDEFFVLKLKDKYAKVALEAYANAVRVDDPEYASQIDDLISRASENSPFCKDPD